MFVIIGGQYPANHVHSAHATYADAQAELAAYGSGYITSSSGAASLGLEVPAAAEPVEAEHIIDWSGDSDADLAACLADYRRGARLAPGTPNGDALAAYARQIEAEQARRKAAGAA